jgi:hypothetical protein
MPDISITDNLGGPVGVKLDLTQPSSLVDYAKAQVLHLLVAPDFVARKDQPLTQAAAQPVRFEARLGNAFPLGLTQPEVTLTPKVDAVLRANTSAGANLFEGEAFPLAAVVPGATGLVGLAMTGALDAGVSGSAGNLTFGLNAGGNMQVEFLKAFLTGPDEPTLGEATGQMLSGYLIPASVDDLKRMRVHDICTVCGTGSLKVSGGFEVATPVNPLATVTLPLNAGTLQVKNGVMAGVSASFTLSGSYQIRARRLANGAIELSYLRERGTRLQADFNAAAALTASFNGADLLGALVGAISTNPSDPALLKGLSPDEVKAFTGALQEGVQHSVQASIDAVLSTASDNQAAFQYELDLDSLDAASLDAVNRALRGDLTGLTVFETRTAAGAAIAPGVKLLDSLLVRARTSGITLKVNLLGIVNLLSLSKLISKCEILFEPASGDLTIKETAQSERLSAITDQLLRQEALRKALFESVLVTTTYRAGKAVALPELDSHALHFVIHRGTSSANVRDYLNWFATLGLIQQTEAGSLLGQYPGDKTSNCVLRTAFNDAACEQLFFGPDGKLRDEAYYLEFGRRALRAMLVPSPEAADQARYRVLDDPTSWKRAVDDGPSPELRHVIPLDPADPHFDMALTLVRGDIYDLVWWAHSMRAAGEALLAVRQAPALQGHRDALQKTMLKVVADSKARFEQPWGMVAFYWAAGSPPTASGRLSAGQWTVARP